jgi:hypothetical protein
VLTFISDHYRPGRRYRVTDPGDAHRLARVQYLRGEEWRECRNANTRYVAHALANGHAPASLTSVARLKVEKQAQELRQGEKVF